MACFTVPAGEAVVTTIIKKRMEKQGTEKHEDNMAVPMTRKLKWLSNLLWGGSALLAFEHVWHGEVQPFFPFLTAMSNPEDTQEMLHEIATVGVSMAVLVTVIWIGMCVTADMIVKRPISTMKTTN
ncbi:MULTISPECIES: hypothetical protein [Pseudobutyrivibrio]|uniref:Uncharacterized protein n=1 Tax=Pseudobutyrivibrio ruminis DSM 9787 TaxID=1123011 RepID=A0A285T0H9_9FIRM|nr:MULTISPECIES: hypothetical protein [Pseudobutyrivibrio]SET38285.1 hypothetical protein SAMN02910413_2757 [Pseudobutyrivibrio sp. C4]SFO57563.1 hypothetical protein SAMN05216351_1175 [Pseudobutyrivibrio sp. JW11]SOC14660.1 hypothetical protein SAMN02910411_0234 [Pseudobutyrivibrio ruminis DSM 9787]